MRLTADVLKLHDPEKVCHQIEAFIRDKTNELQRAGVALGLSGGLDSVVVAYLCTRSVGPDKVLALYMPDKDSKESHGMDARKVADELGIGFETIKLTPLLEKLGVYELIPTRILGSSRITGCLLKLYFRITRAIGRDQYEAALMGTNNPFVARGDAYAKTKHRLRAVILYMEATVRNLLVVGAANKTEWLIGFFSKWGIDHAADIMPLMPFYKAQVRQLAAFLGVSEKIITKPPSPDLVPGITDETVVESYHVLDLILFGLENELSNKEIASQLAIPERRVEQIHRWAIKSAHMRSSPYVPDLIL